MSSVCHLEIAGYPVCEDTGNVHPLIMTIFQDSERHTKRRKRSDRNPIVRDDWTNWLKVAENEEETAFQYSTLTTHAIQRLDIMGFTLERARKEFEAGIASSVELVAKTDPSMEFWRFESSEQEYRPPSFYREERIRLYRNFSFDRWLQAIKEIISRRLKSRWSIVPKDEPFIYEMLSSNRPEIESFEFQYSDIRYFLRAVLEVCDDDAPVVLDYTELVGEGYYEADDELRKLALEELSQDFVVNQKIIVLTEGSSDTRILEQTLSVLYPQLVDYFSFVDFTGSNLRGGAGSLVSTIKAFVGAGIQNRTVALFDNDTAASEALRGLSNVTLPNNIKVLRLPSLDFARSYPTIGPHGKVNMDINGLACSIEVYLGKDILTNGNGELVPVQWTGYSRIMSQYQGEILDKSRLQKSYLEELTQATSCPETRAKRDYRHMEKVFNTIFSAFK